LLRQALALVLVLVVLRGLVPGFAVAGEGRSPAVGLPAALGVPAAVGVPAVGTPTRPLPESSEALASRSPWSRPESYPLAQQPRADLYQPSATWIGRLILPTPEDLAAPQAPREDWVWIEIERAPAEREALIGQRLRLRWADRQELRRLVQTVTTTIQLGEAARQAAAAANVVPSRLDGRRVGPLQSLAGARPRDDVTVALESVSFKPFRSPLAGELRIASPPLQITGRWQGLVMVVGRAAAEDLWRVRHHNRASAAFDGAEETIRIPSLPPDRFGHRLLDPAGLLASPYNAKGWLIQGSPAADGVFTVQALLPYALLDLSANRVVAGTDPALAYVRHDSWRHPLRRGRLSHTALIPDHKPPPPWALGERALLMHLFGGIGGEDGEVVQGWTVTGHFAFGEAEVVRDAFTGRPRLAIRYHQIYASNPNGIISGSQDWSAYAGSLQRGWIGLRPFSDLLIPMGEEVLDAIDLQAELMAARYRSGDGGGVTLVTPATSCVQDSAQALWIAIQQLRRERLGAGGREDGSAGGTASNTAGSTASSAVGNTASSAVGNTAGSAAGRTLGNPAGGPEGEGEPEAMSAVDRERLRELGLAFDHLLEPFGRVRGDWKRNAATALAAGTGAGSGATALGLGADPFQASQSLRDALLSWRSLLPRSAHDLFAAEFLRVGLPLLELRTNQIPGVDPRLEPLAPTALFGQLPGVSLLLGRLGDSLFPLWKPGGQLAALLVAVVYGVLALILGQRSGLLRRPWHWSPLRRLVPHALGVLIVPAFAEELLFRGLLLPSALDGVRPLAMLPWMVLSVGLFVLWHALKAPIARGRWRHRRPISRVLPHPSLGPAALLQITLLGTACTLVVVVSGSLWPAVLLHGVAVVAWRAPGPRQALSNTAAAPHGQGQQGRA
jgi:predicted Abi (CAAX) family protease